MPSSESIDRGNVAERAAARKYGLDATDERTGYYDLRASNGCRYQVKSATYERSSGNPGKFRFWKRHLRRLDREQSAVILTLTATDDPEHVLTIVKVSTSEVIDTIGGRWFPSEHADDMGEQYRVPWPDLVDY